MYFLETGFVPGVPRFERFAGPVKRKMKIYQIQLATQVLVRMPSPH